MHASNFKMMVPGYVFSWRLLPALALVMASAVAAPAQEVDGDFEGETQYTDKEGNVRELKEPSAKERKKVTDLFAAGKANSKEEEQAFEDLAHYYVNALTQKKNIAVLGDKRKELKAKYLAPAGQKNRTVTDLHTRLNELTLTTCRQVAEDPKYPRAVRYNCMLMIGDLDAEENQPGTANSTVPWPTATTALFEIARDEKQQVTLRYGALIGLKRHVSLGVAASLHAQLAETLLGILGTPIADESNPDGQIWLRVRSANVLHDAIQKQIPVDEAKFAAALVERIDDEKMPHWARAMLAGDLGKLNGRSVPPAKVPVAARSLAGLLLSICQTSSFAVDPEAEAQKDKPEEAGKKGDKKGGEKAAGNKGDKGSTDKKEKGDAKKDESNDKAAAATAVAAEPPSPAVQKLNSEETMWQLAQIRAALYGRDAATAKEKGADPAHGLYAAASDDAAKAMIDKIVGHVDELVRVLADVPEGKDVFSKLADNLRTASQDLQDMLSVPVAEEEAEPAAKPVAGRPRQPAGNSPADASAAGN